MIRFILTSLILIMPFKSHALTDTENFYPKTIIFDFGGVMIDFDLNNLHFYIAKELEMPIDEFRLAIKKEINLLATGQLNEEDFWIQFANKYDVSLPKNWNFKCKEFIKCNVDPKYKMYNLIIKLKEKGFQISMLSDVTEWEANSFQELGLYEEFDPIALSYEIKTRKPNNESYYAILKKLNLTPDQCLFIDDRIENVQHAEKLGIKSLHFESHDQLVTELKKLNILF